MSNSEEEVDRVKITKSAPKLTPPGYTIQLSTEQAVQIAQFVDSPIFKLLERVYVAQRKDHIARTLLNAGQTVDNLYYFKGMAAELVLFFQNLQAVKKALAEEEK